MALPENSSGDVLGFIDAVLDAFAFLEHEHGFERVSESPRLVRYERGPFFVEIICEVGVDVLLGRRARLRDGAVGLWRQLRHEWGVEFPLDYLAEAMGAEDELDHLHAFVTSPTEAQADIEQLANFVRRHGSGLLGGDDDAYRAVAAVGRRQSKEMTDRASGR